LPNTKTAFLIALEHFVSFHNFFRAYFFSLFANFMRIEVHLFRILSHGL